jgi:hypothetical protein
MTTTMRVGLLLLLLIVAGAREAQAQVPPVMPVQGVLTDIAGVPISGPRTMAIRLYAADMGGTAIYTETSTVMVDQGAFTVYVGSVTPLSLGTFSGANLYVGITVGTDAEMTPRLRIGSVPYAAFAAECASVPTGAVMFFELPACPAGWTDYGALTGRVPVGVGATGTVGGPVGAALADGGNRTINAVPAHTHAIDPPATTSTADGQHTHTVDPAAVNSDPGSPHSHTGTTSSENVPLDLGNGGGYGTTMVQGAAGAGDLNQNSPADTHNHTFTTSVEQSHAHSVNVGLTMSSSEPDHTHSTNIASFTSGSTGTPTVDVTMPYVQLRACRKN